MLPKRREFVNIYRLIKKKDIGLINDCVVIKTLLKMWQNLYTCTRETVYAVVLCSVNTNHCSSAANFQGELCHEDLFICDEFGIFLKNARNSTNTNFLNYDM